MTDASILDDLAARGLIHDATDESALRARLEAGPVTLYSGFDPTADSLHVGNLIPLLVLRRFQDAGHRPIALAGGATGMIGDPSGRSDERNLLDDDVLAINVEAISGQLRRVLDFTPGPTGATLVDNRSWTAPVTVLDFLRDVGKHFTVNAMLGKESVRSRIEGESGISFTEFSYMLLQANDYWWLHQHEGCELQIGGSDQWGNITAGIDLIRRRTATHVHGLSFPLLLRSDGQKFGKSADGAVWLDAGRTSPYAFYQYWMNVDDRDVERFLLQMTLIPVADALAVAATHSAAPERRDGQRRLAEEVTTLVHGADQARAAAAASQVLFGGDPQAADAETFAMLAGELAVSSLAELRHDGGVEALDAVMATGLAKSRSDARKGFAAGEFSLNGVRRAADERVASADLLHDRFLLVRRGKKRYALLAVD
ncbi:MAG TPA: tyrosine--tRNA ligase [Acidimicrobiales bacterium]